MSEDPKEQLSLDEIQRMVQVIAKIESTKDDGLYAKLYLKDVKELLQFTAFLSQRINMLEMREKLRVKFGLGT